MPLVSRTFDQLIDFTRTSAGTFVGSNGLIQSTPASVNLLTYTQEFDNAAWIKSLLSVTANAVSAPDGTSTADKVFATAAGGIKALYPNITLTAAAYVFSVYAKSGEYSLLRIAEGGSGRFYASFDLSSGSVISGTTGGTQFTSASITPAGNGWYRCAVVIAGTAAAYAPSFCGYPAGATLTNYGADYAGDGTSGIYAWGAQLELGSTATTYTRNFGGLFPPRFDYDPVTLAPRGLLIEEQRTNLLTYSEQFDNASWDKTNLTATSNSVAAPDGSTTADTLTLTNTGGFVTQAATVNATSCTFSVYMRKGTSSVFGLLIRNSTTATDLCRFSYNFDTGAVNLASGSGTATFVSVGGGWFRATITVTAGITSGDSILPYVYAADTTGLTGEFSYVWGAQLEAGAFATSYIPTVASQVTRTADIALIQAPNFSQWYNQSEGTFVVDFDCSGSSSALSADDSTNNNFMRVGRLNTTGRLRVFTGGVEQADVLPANTPGWVGSVKLATAYRVNDFAASASGGTVSTDVSGTVPATTQLRLGTSGAGDPVNGHIRSIRCYPVRLSDAQLQALTA